MAAGDPRCSHWLGANGLDYSIASYAAPAQTWNPNTTSQQLLWDSDTEMGSPGVPNSTCPMSVPSGCFQGRFFGGAPLATLDPATGQTYGQQGFAGQEWSSRGGGWTI